MLRPAVAEDVGAIARVLQRSKAVAMPWLAVVHDDAEDRAWLAGVLLPTRRVVVVEQDGGVVAVSALHGCELDALYVAPEAQGRGLGRALLDDAKTASGGHVELWAFTRNLRARRFYAAAGFVQVAETDGAGNEEREPDVRLEWSAPGTLLR